MASHRNMQIADNEDENHLDSVNCLETLGAAALVTIRGESVNRMGLSGSRQRQYGDLRQESLTCHEHHQLYHPVVSMTV